MLFVPIVVLVSQTAFAQCRIEGALRTVDGKPIAGATIRVQGPELPSILTTTGADGRYGVDNIKPGIRVQVVAYENGRTISHAYSLVTLFVETIDLKVEPELAVAAGADLDPNGGPSGEVRGIVRSAEGALVPGARIAIGETAVTTTSDAAGRYAFSGLRSGLPIDLDVSASGFEGHTAQVVVPTRGYVDADVSLKPASASVADRTSQSLIDGPGDGSSLAMQPSGVTAIPSLARGDVFRALQFMPAASGTLEASSELFVRGGTPDQTLITYDGFTIYPLPHRFGGFSALNMDAIAGADFSATAADAVDGGRLAGALRLTGATASTLPTGSADLSILGWGASVGAPLGDRASFLLAARGTPSATLYDVVLNQVDGGGTSAARSRVPRFSGGPLGLSPAAAFHDVNGKLEVRMTPTDRASLTIYDARDADNRSRDLPMPSTSGSIAEPAVFTLPETAVAQQTVVETWTGRGASAMWQHEWSPTVKTTASLGHSEFSRSADSSSLLTNSASGIDLSFAAGRGGSAAVVETNHINDTTLRVASEIGVGYAHFATAGVEMVSLDTGYGALTEAFRHAPASSAFTSTLVGLVDRANTGRLMTVFAQDDWRPAARLTISPGARLTHDDLAASTYFDPRVGASYRVGQQVRVSGSWSVDHQAANRITREDLVHGDDQFWTLADGVTVRVPSVRQAVAGISFEMPGLLWDLHAYYRSLDDLTLFAPRLFPGVAPDLTNTLWYAGSGTAKGVEMLVQSKAAWNTVWASYALGRAENKYPGLEADAFPASNDQTHEVKVTDTVRIGDAWSLGGVWLFGSGRPYTPALNTVPVWLPTGDSEYQIAFGPKNSARLPAYHRLDLSAARELRLRRLRAALVATVFNAYDRQNISYLDYEAAADNVAANDVTLLRRTFNLALRFAF